MPKSLPATARFVLVVNARAARIGGWEAATILAALQVSGRYGINPTLAWIAEQTGLSSASIHRLLRALTKQGLVCTTGTRKSSRRCLTQLGRSKLKNLCGSHFQIERTDS